MRKRLLESENDIILNSIYELTHLYDEDGNEVPSYFNIKEIIDNYGLSQKDVIDIAKNHNYNVFRIPGGDNLVNTVIIAHEDLSYGDIVKEDTTKVDIKELGDDTNDSFNMEEDMEEVKPWGHRKVFEQIKQDTNNFTLESGEFSYSFEEECRLAYKILSNKYEDVDYSFVDNWFSPTGETWHISFSGPLKGKKKVVKEDTSSNSLIGKPVKFNDVDFTIAEIEEDDDDVLFTISNKDGNKMLSKVAIDKGTLTSDDADVNAYFDTLRTPIEEPKEIEPTIEPELTPQEKEIKNKNEVIQQALQDASNDYAEYKKNSPMIKEIQKARKSGKYDRIPTMYPELYADTYFKEFMRIKNSVNSKVAREYFGIIEKTYPGDVEELIKWLRKAITSISVSCGDALMKVTKERVDFLNERDNTDVEINYQSSKQWSSWVAEVSTKEEILNEMPQEVLTWKIEKNSGVSIDDVELGLVYNQKQHKITSNPVVIDLLFEYNFKLGIQNKKSEDLEEDEPLQLDSDKVKLTDLEPEDLKYAGVKDDIEKPSFDIQKVSNTQKVSILDICSILEYAFKNHVIGQYTYEKLKNKYLNSDLEYVTMYIFNFDDALLYELRDKDLGAIPLSVVTIDYENFEDIRNDLNVSNYIDELLNFNYMSHFLEKNSLKEGIEKHDELNPKLFDGEELKPEVKEAIQKIADEFIKELNEDEVNFTLKDIVLLGSNVSYNYTKDSDLDIHLIADSSALDCPESLLDKLYGAYRSIFNKNYEITLKDIPAEIYVELDEPKAKSNGIYSLNNGWIKKPEAKDIPELDEEAFGKLFTLWEDDYFDLLERESTSEEIAQFIENIYELRKESIAEEGEYGLGNLVFKEFRNLGYLDKLKDLRKELKGKELSLEHLEEELDTSKYNTLEAIEALSSSVKDNGTYSVDKDGKLRKENLTSGYQVSFFRPEITNEDLNLTLKTIDTKLGEAYLGKWGTPEISYCVNDKTLANNIAKIFNQDSIWDNSKTNEEGYDGDKNSDFDSELKVDYKKAVEELKSLLN